MIPASLPNAKAAVKGISVDQERKLRVRRRSDTVVVLTINATDQGWGTRPSRLSLNLSESKVYEFRGEYGRKTET